MALGSDFTEGLYDYCYCTKKRIFKKEYVYRTNKFAFYRFQSLLVLGLFGFAFSFKGLHLLLTKSI